MHHALTAHHIAQIVETWGYLGIFLCVFVGNLGFPVPAESVFSAAGFLAGRDILSLKMVILVAFVSAVVGDNFGYMLGRTGGRQVLVRVTGSSTWLRWRYLRFKAFFDAHGNKTIFVARFVAGLRFVAGPMGGALQMPFLRFFRWDGSGGVVGGTGGGVPGFFFGRQLGVVCGQVPHA